MRGEITMIPVGGLANRMRAVASAVALAADVGRVARIVWFQDWALHAPFGLLFKSVPAGVMNGKVKDASVTDRWLLDRPRKRNLYMPALFQKLMFRSCLYEESMPRLIRSRFDFRQWAQDGGGYLASCYAFYPYPKALVRKLFVPLPDVQDEISRRVSAFSAYTIGVHVRRTDHVCAIKESPLDLFFEKIDAELAAHPDLKIYLATDSEEVKRQMRMRYAGRVLASAQEAERGSIAGMKDGVAEMYALSRTCRIYGSYGSSFSEMAAEIGDVPFVVVRRSPSGTEVAP